MNIQGIEEHSFSVIFLFNSFFKFKLFRKIAIIVLVLHSGEGKFGYKIHTEIKMLSDFSFQKFDFDQKTNGLNCFDFSTNLVYFRISFWVWSAKNKTKKRKSVESWFKLKILARSERCKSHSKIWKEVSNRATRWQCIYTNTSTRTRMHSHACIAISFYVCVRELWMARIWQPRSLSVNYFVCKVQRSRGRKKNGINYQNRVAEKYTLPTNAWNKKRCVREKTQHFHSCQQ